MLISIGMLARKEIDEVIKTLIQSFLYLFIILLNTIKYKDIV